jgi:[acyl-carrier-protein] S-malonyltransferase
MGKRAYVFPGQGSQSVGMGRAIADNSRLAKGVFAEADEVLDFPLSALCFEGPEEKLNLTENTQPALLTTSVALWKEFEAHAPEPDYVAGHSLGEYSALVAAGSLAFADAVRVVRARGQLMEAAVPAGNGAMAAVLGLDRETLETLCRDVSTERETVELANLNCPGQIVISGSSAGVKAAAERARKAGARRVVPLAVSGPFHSSLMKPAGERLQKVLEGVRVQSARIPVVANVCACPLRSGDDIERALVRQVAAPVLWEDSVRWMLEQGVDTFVEIGPGRVLSGLIRKIDRKANVYHVGDPESLEKTLRLL